MKSKVLAGLLILAMTTGMAAGCGKKEVDYNLNTEERVEEGTEVRAETGLDKFKTIATWEEDWIILGENGAEQPMIADADVIIPDMDKLPVVEVEQLEFDAEYREQFLTAFYADSEIYDYGKEEYREQLATAPDDYVVAEDYVGSDSFIGYVGDTLCTVNFSKEFESVFAYPLQSDRSYLPEALQDYQEVYRMSPEEIDGTENRINECRFSMEEARALADTFLAQIGRGGQRCTEASETVWGGENRDVAGNPTDVESMFYGYTFTYGTGIGTMGFNQFPNFSDFDFAWQEDYDAADFNNGDSITIVVTDAGVTEVAMDDPVIVRRVSDPVDIVAMDTVKDIIKEETKANTQKYEFSNGANVNPRRFSRLELIYIKVKDNSQEGIYSYIPAWCASDCSGEGNTWATSGDENMRLHPVFVNAIDGTIIDMRNGGETDEA